MNRGVVRGIAHGALVVSSDGDISFQPDNISNDALIIKSGVGSTQPSLTIASLSNTVNGLTITPAASGGNPAIACTGTGTNIGLSVDGKGAGSVSFGSNVTGDISIGNGTGKTSITTAATNIFRVIQSGVTFQVQGVASADNGVLITGAVDGANPSIGILAGLDTNVTLVLNGLGTGGAAVLGTSTNDNATAGYVGQQILSTLGVGSEVSLTTATTANVTSITLTAGDWDVTGVVDFDLGAATVTRFQAGSSVTSATLDAQDTFSDDPSTFVTTTAINADIIPTWRRSVAAGGATIYLVANATFSVGTVKAYGTIRARRVR